MACAPLSVQLLAQHGPECWSLPRLPVGFPEVQGPEGPPQGERAQALPLLLVADGTGLSGTPAGLGFLHQLDGLASRPPGPLSRQYLSKG